MKNRNQTSAPTAKAQNLQTAEVVIERDLLAWAKAQAEKQGVTFDQFLRETIEGERAGKAKAPNILEWLASFDLDNEATHTASVEIELPIREWFAYARCANRYGCSIGEMLSEFLMRQMADAENSAESPVSEKEAA